MRRGEGGFTLAELLVVVATVGILASMAIPAYASALERAHRSALLSDGKVLYDAMTRFYIDRGEFPSTVTPPTNFDRRTFEPLVSAGYLRDAEGIRAHLLDAEVTAFDSPDAGSGTNREFWAVLTAAADPAIKLLVASTAGYPGCSGDYDGLYWIEGAALVRAR